MNVLLAFIRRDHLIMTSYKFSFLWQLLALAAIIAGLRFLGEVVLADSKDSVVGISRDYFDFLLTGIAFTDALTFGLTAFPRSIQGSQAAGTLEPMLLARFRLHAIVLYSSAHGFLVSLVRLGVYVAAGVLMFGLWHNTNLASFVAVVALSLLTFGSLGLMSAAFVLVMKQGDPIIGIYAMMAGLLGGALFPTSMLPMWLQPFAVLVPLTHTLSGVRAALAGAAPWEIGDQLGILTLFAAAFLPSALFLFNWALNHAKAEGSLAQY